MLTDLSVAPLGALRADVCVFGGGPAGITLALELARRRPDWQVVLAEAGGRGVASERERAIYGVELGERRYLFEASRRRMLGGTSAHWGGWCRPLDPTDFAAPPGWPLPAWPFGPDELQPWMAAAHRWCEIDSPDYSTTDIRQRLPGHLLDFPADAAIADTLFRFSPPTRFGKRYLADIEAQPNLRCLLHANLTGLIRSGDGIESASVRSLDGNATQIAADHFVLALGGLETTRFLLNLRGEDSADGEGLRSPHLGTCFADHFGLRPGRIVAPADLRYSRFSDGGAAVMPVLQPGVEARRSGRLQNSCMMLNPVPEPDPLIAYAGQPALGFRSGEYWNYDVQMIVEPRPNPESRLSLVGERCELGLRRLRVDWKIDAGDYDSAYALFDALGQQLGAQGLGRSRRMTHNTAENRALSNGAYHHMGSTRMAAAPDAGVVDADLRVFDQHNLYVCSSSVFPRYGFSNPTLTLTALAARLAGHLSGTEPEAVG